MKRVAVFLLLAAALLLAEDKDKSQVTVKNSEVTNHVVLIAAVERGKQLELQCTDGQWFCTQLKPGPYQMVRLPKNRGLYDCKCADVYPATADPDKDEKLGEYCIND